MPLSAERRDTLFGKLHRRLRDAVLDGRLAPGARLASTRALAAELGVSRTTTSAVYDQLVADGYFTTRRGSGTFVADELPTHKLPAPREPEKSACAPRLSAWAERLMAEGPDYPYDALRRLPRARYDFLYGVPDVAAFPNDVWRRIVGRLLRRGSARSLGYASPEGMSELRAAIASQIALRRGVSCSAAQVLVTTGAQQALALLARVLGGAGRRALIEEPHYIGIRSALAAEGTELVPVAVDEDGMKLASLWSRRRRAALAVVTPSHQFPTGAVLSLARRLELLDWARSADAFVIEDDYDSEFRYEGQPVESLQSLDRDERVIYVGTFSKTLAPALRVGFVIAPERLMRPLRAAKWLADWSTAPLPQLALAELLTEGHFARHLRKMRAKYARRRAALLAALSSELGDRALPSGAPAGLHLFCALPGVCESELDALSIRAREAGVGIHSARPCYLGAPPTQALILGYARLTEAEIAAGMRRLGRAFRSVDNRSR